MSDPMSRGVPHGASPPEARDQGDADADNGDVASAFCATLVDEWVNCGLTDAVVSPGSRSTPMTLALDAEYYKSARLKGTRYEGRYGIDDDAVLAKLKPRGKKIQNPTK